MDCPGWDAEWITLAGMRLDLLGFFQDVIIKNKISARYKISVGGHHQIVLMFNIGVGV